MRICFLSRRYFPTISGMSVYADNLVRQLARLGHDVTMVSQYYGGATAGVYGGGPPPGVPGVRVVGMESVGEQSSGDFEGDIGAMVDRVVALHGEEPFDLIHAQYGYPTGYAALLAAERLGRPCVVSIQGGDGHWVGDCCDTHRRAMQLVCDHADALLIGSDSFAREVHGRLGTALGRFTIVPGAVDTRRFRPEEGREPGDLSAVPHVLCHGRVDRRKGVFEAVAAVRDAARRGPRGAADGQRHRAGLRRRETRRRRRARRGGERATPTTPTRRRCTARPTCSSARRTPRGFPTRFWRRWRPACRSSRAGRSAWSTA